MYFNVTLRLIFQNQVTFIFAKKSQAVKMVAPSKAFGEKKL